MGKVEKTSVQEAAEDLKKKQAAYEKNKSVKNLTAKREAAQRLKALKLGKVVPLPEEK